ELDETFERGLLAILTPEQQDVYRERRERIEKRRNEAFAREAADNTPLSDEQILRLQQIPLFNVLWSITISPRFERLDRDLKFSDEQAPKVRQLLKERRDGFLALVDAAPPPTITLSALAGLTEKLGEPGSEPAPPR